MLAHYYSLCSVNKSPLSAQPLIRADLIEFQKERHECLGKQHAEGSRKQQCAVPWKLLHVTHMQRKNGSRPLPIPFYLQSGLYGSSLTVSASLPCFSEVVIFYVPWDGPLWVFQDPIYAREMPLNLWSFQYKGNQLRNWQAIRFYWFHCWCSN